MRITYQIPLIQDKAFDSYQPQNLFQILVLYVSLEGNYRVVVVLKFALADKLGTLI